jgi:hypothetical protein
MDHPATYIPKVSDEVAVSEHSGSSFIVHSVDTDKCTVDVRQIGPSNAVNIVGIHWDALKLLRTGRREDLNRAAARVRVVREATERT